MQRRKNYIFSSILPIDIGFEGQLEDCEFMIHLRKLYNIKNDQGSILSRKSLILVCRINTMKHLGIEF
jgi:hypothetical protein